LESNYVSIFDISIALVWMIIFFIIANSRAKKVEDAEIRKYYMRNVAFKFFFSISFAVVYLIYYGGGDTTSYWDGAVSLNKLFMKSPAMYMEQMMGTNDLIKSLGYFDVETGYPPGWLSRESEAWFICKLASIVSFFTLRSYFAGTLFLAFFAAMASWRVFEMISKLHTHKKNIAALCILFIPTVSFWCTGISKDTIIFISVLNLLYYAFDVMVLKNRISFKHVFVVLLSLFLIYQVRSFIIAAILAPLFMAFGARMTKKYESNFMAKIFLRSMILFGGIFLFLVFFASDFANEMVNEAQIVQQDFINNEIYTGKRYEISNTDASPTGLIRAIPESIFYGIYRPFINESFSPTLIINGLESLVLMFLTLRFFTRRNLFSKIKKIRKEEILVFALIFSLFIAFMAGFTSVLFGVLVRIRAPLLPFFFLVLTTQIGADTEEKKIEN